MLEATVICLDNSEYSRNCDYTPSRLDAQCDAANLICGTKTNQNPENSVGIITSGGERVIVRVTPTQDLGKILQGLHDISAEGEADIVRAVQTAQLALKHRMNKNQRQRIVLFVGSPVTATEKQLEQLGRVLKKNNISLDIISFGEIELNSAKLQKLHNTVNSNATSRFLECAVDSSRIISDMLLVSPIITDGDSSEGLIGVPGAAQMVGMEGREGLMNPDIGVDPRTDPELYMALQISMLEERERQARADAAAEALAPGAIGTATTPTTAQEERGNPAVASADQLSSNPAAADIQAMEGIDDELRQALLISLDDFRQATRSANQPPDVPLPNNITLQPSASVERAMGDDMSIIPPEDAGDISGAASAKTATMEDLVGGDQLSSVPNATALIQQLLDMPGVDMTDRGLLDALQFVNRDPAGTGSHDQHKHNSDKESDQQDGGDSPDKRV